MYVIKASGETEKFDLEKIKRTCLRAGATKELAEKIAKEVKKRSYDGITTREILHITLTLLRREEPHIASRYDLKGSLLRLGPAGFAFENLVSEILKEYGYSTKLRVIVNGACVSHEIDVIAEKDNKNYMIECKYHNFPGVYTGLKETLYTYARFLDLREGWEKGTCRKFEEPWLICNTKFSEDAIKYSKCKGINLIGWNYPSKNNLKELIERKRLYPITILRNLDKKTQIKLANLGLVLAIDLLRTNFKELVNITKISTKKLKVLINEAEKVCYKS
jgi:Holliday junction resolvase